MNQHFKVILFFTILFLIRLNTSAQNPVNPYKAPLYWDVYENNFLQEKAGVTNNYITEADFLSNINWVDANLKSLGYKMICIDGWGDMPYDQNGYRTKHSSAWVHDYAWWSAQLQQRGMTLGIYDNPLWINTAAAAAGVKVVGTNILLSSLINTSENAKWFTWLQVDRPGAEQYVKGCIQHYADMGVKYLRVDFLSWYESGWDRYLGIVGVAHTLSNYQTALRWMREACDANGIFLSLVMPNLYSDAVTEQTYGHMIRIDEDCAEGAWSRFSDNVRGVKRTGWSVYANPFDGYTYWSKIAGKGKMILDGDFIRLNTFANDEERKSVVSLHLIAGGPVSIADQYNTIGNSLWIYQNQELLALNRDGFVGKPLSGDPSNALSQVWKGQMSNGDWIVAFFNREATSQTRSINFSTDLGITGNAFVRDLWSHSDLGSMSSISQAVISHGCKVYRISSSTNKVMTPVFSQISGTYSGGCVVSLSTSTVNATIYYTTDGSTPTTASAIYSSPLNITVNTVLTALAVKSGMDNSFAGSQTYNIQAVTPQTAMYIGASFNNWTPSSLPMMNSGGNQWYTNPINLAAGNYQMKFVNTTNWTGNDWGNATGLSGMCTITTGGLPNISFNLSAAGNYSFFFNDAMLNYSINQNTATVLHSFSKGIEICYIRLQNIILIQLPFSSESIVQVFNMRGEILFSEHYFSNEIRLPVKMHWPDPLVIVRIATKDGYFATKINLL